MVSIPIRDFQKPYYPEINFLPVAHQVDDPTGATIQYLEGVYDETLGLSKIIREPNKPLIIDGQGKTTLKQGLSIMDCHNVWIRGLNYEGCLELNDSYPEIGLKGIKIQNVHGKYGKGGRILFMGGHNIDGIEILDSSFLYQMNGTHSVYLSGGHWDSNYPPVRNVTIARCIMGHTWVGRNAFQFNGRGEKFLIEDCLFLHAQMNGITLIGVQGATVKNNVSYGHNRGSGIVIYDYLWSGYDYGTQEGIEAFKATHHPCQNILVDRNTFVVGPTQFCKDAWHSDDPRDGHPAILINNNPAELFEYPSKNLYITNNILCSPNGNLIDIYHEQEAKETYIIHNMAWVTSDETPTIGNTAKVKYLEKNFIKNPQFAQGMPKYPFVNLIENPGYYMEDFKSSFNPYSWTGKGLDVGACVKPPSGIWVKGSKGGTAQTVSMSPGSP